MEPHQKLRPMWLGEGVHAPSRPPIVLRSGQQLTRLVQRLVRVARRGPWRGSREASAPTRPCDAPCRTPTHAAPMLRHLAALPGDLARLQSPAARYIQEVEYPMRQAHEQVTGWQDIRQQCVTVSDDLSAAVGEQVVPETILQAASCNPIVGNSTPNQRTKHNQTGTRTTLNARCRITEYDQTTTAECQVAIKRQFFFY